MNALYLILEGHFSPGQKTNDRKKDAYLRKQDYKLMLISGSIVNRMPQVLKRIKNTVKLKTKGLTLIKVTKNVYVYGLFF